MIDNFINNVYDAFTLESVTDIGDVVEFALVMGLVLGSLIGSAYSAYLYFKQAKALDNQENKSEEIDWCWIRGLYLWNLRNFL